MRIGKELESLDFGFFEMPIPPEDREGYAELARALAIPIALDSLMTCYETLDFLRRGGLDIVQPDVCRAGGITRMPAYRGAGGRFRSFLSTPHQYRFRDSFRGQCASRRFHAEHAHL
jgi:hypothetical protein